MFPFSNFCKKFNEPVVLTRVCCGIAYLNLEFNDSIGIVIGSKITILNKNDIIAEINSDKFLSSKGGKILNLKRYNLLEIKEFDITQEDPEGCMILHFEANFKLKIHFDSHYESVTINFNDGEYKGFWVF